MGVYFIILESPCPSVLEFLSIVRGGGRGVGKNGGILESTCPSVLEWWGAGGGGRGGREWGYTRIDMSVCPRVPFYNAWLGGGGVEKGGILKSPCPPVLEFHSIGRF